MAASFSLRALRSARWAEPMRLRQWGVAARSLSATPRFNKVEDSDVDVFRSIIQTDTAILTAPEDVHGYNQDWMKKFKGHSQLVLRPKTTEEVSEILKHCNERKLAVVPQSGNTGLVGGSVPLHDEIVLSLNRMDKIKELDEVSSTVVVEAGCILENVDKFLHDRGFIFPLDLGAKGSCMIGGNVSTNAGGLRFARYGSLHSTVLGLTVVLADGTVLNNLSTLKKDNTGYDLKHLFIGAEGTLGVITEIALAVPPAPKAKNVVLLACESFDMVQKAFVTARRQLAEILSAVEFFDRHSLELATEQLAHIRDPLSAPSAFYLLLETSGANSEHDAQKLESYLAHVMEEGLVTDGTMAQDQTQIDQLWSIREGITEALRHAGYVYKYDVSVPVPVMYDAVVEMRQRLEGKARVVGYGHLGDGNLHLNVSLPTEDDEVKNIIEPRLYQWTASNNGSVSAEHGLGQIKPQYISYSKPSAMIGIMHDIKKMLDPNGILNPGKVLVNEVVNDEFTKA